MPARRCIRARGVAAARRHDHELEAVRQRVAALTGEHTLAHVTIGAAIALGAVIGLALGIVISVTADLPLAPEAGLVPGALVGWLLGRDRT